MVRFVFVAAAALSLVAPAVAGGNMQFFWPHHGPMDIVISRDHRARTSSDGVLPHALLYGPDGPREIPYTDHNAHRPVGMGTVRFARPTWGGHRLDWCLHPRSECGPVAAQAFCAAKGFRRVVEVVKEEAVGRYAHTTQIGSGLACAGAACNGFARIVCTRE